MHKISIIIPVYNVEKYLPQCLDSVINQTYRNLEIIVVNDGSTDSCPQICGDFAAKDNRIKVLNQKNAGSAHARNIGLQNISGDFIGFVDSDDLVALDFYEKLLNILIQSDADIAECGFTMFENDIVLGGGNSSGSDQTEIFDTEKALELIMKGPLSVVVWNKIYRKDVIAKVLFPIDKYIDDEYWTYKVFGNAKKIVKISNELYFYRQQPGSLMGKKYSLKRLDALDAHKERISYMSQYFPALENLAIKVFCFISMSHYHQISIHEHLDPHKIVRNKVFSTVKKFNKLLIVKKWYWKDIIWYQLFLWSPKNYMKLRDYMEMKVQKRLHIK